MSLLCAHIPAPWGVPERGLSKGGLPVSMDLQSTTRWARLAEKTASVRCTDRRVPGRRPEMLDLERSAFRVGGIVIVLRCVKPKTRPHVARTPQ